MDGYRNPNLAGYANEGKNPQRITPEQAEALTMADYGLTPEAVKANMFGLEVRDPKNGQEMPDEFYYNILEIALDQAEKTLDVVVFPRYEEEYQDFTDTEFSNHMYTHVYRRPILQVDYMGISLNGRPVRQYPKDWYNVYQLAGHLEILPSPFMRASDTITPYQQVPYLPVMGGMYTGAHQHSAPQMIELKYVAGMLPREKRNVTREWEIPPVLERLIVKLATREVFQMWGNLIVQPGIANRSISIDGIHESVGTTQSATYSAVSANINQINADIDELTKAARSYFGTNMVGL